MVPIHRGCSKSATLNDSPSPFAPRRGPLHNSRHSRGRGNPESTKHAFSPHPGDNHRPFRSQGMCESLTRNHWRSAARVLQWSPAGTRKSEAIFAGGCTSLIRKAPIRYSVPHPSPNKLDLLHPNLRSHRRHEVFPEAAESTAAQ